MEFVNELRVAIVQTTLDNRIAWDSSASYAPRMAVTEAKRVWDEILTALTSYRNLSKSAQPEIIVLPELTIPKQYEKDIVDMAVQLESIIIGGCDFKTDDGITVVNRGLMAVPSYWPHGEGKVQSLLFHFGKKNPAALENNYIKSIPQKSDNKKQMSFYHDDTVYIINLGCYGRLGIAICADFYDIERYAYYKGRIQHLIILAYNKDIKSFYFLAESISRLVYCNTIICNTGHYGGSIAFSLYQKDYNRYVYKHEGKGLYTSQIVSLPVKDLWIAQCDDEHKLKTFKSMPPGYEYMYEKYENRTPDVNSIGAL